MFLKLNSPFGGHKQKSASSSERISNETDKKLIRVPVSI